MLQCIGVIHTLNMIEQFFLVHNLYIADLSAVQNLDFKNKLKHTMGKNQRAMIQMLNTKNLHMRHKQVLNMCNKYFPK